MADTNPSVASKVMEWSRPVIAVFAITVYTYSFYISHVSEDKSQQSLLTGSIMTIMATIVGYYFGSSSGQQKKDDVIGAIAQAPIPPPVVAPVVVAPPPPGATGPTGAIGPTGASN